MAFLFGGITQLAVASRVQSWRWLYILSGIMGVAAGIGTFFWPDITLYVVSILVAWYLIAFGIIHLVDALAGPKVGWWWTGLLLGIGELVLGVWAVRSWERSLLTLMTLVGVWAIIYGVNQIFAAFTLREAGKRDGAGGRLIATAETSRGQLPCRGPAAGKLSAGQGQGGGVSARARRHAGSWLSSPDLDPAVWPPSCRS